MYIFKAMLFIKKRNSNLNVLTNKKELNFFYDSTVLDTSKGLEWNIYHDLGRKPLVILCNFNSDLKNRALGLFYPDYDNSTASYIRILSYGVNANTGVYRIGIFAI